MSDWKEKANAAIECPSAVVEMLCEAQAPSIESTYVVIQFLAMIIQILATVRCITHQLISKKDVAACTTRPSMSHSASTSHTQETD